MDARRDWATGVIDGDPPEISQTEREGLCLRKCGVVEVVAGFF